MYIHVKAKTEAGKEEVIKVSADHYEIAVREPAKRNEANKRIIEIVRKLFSGRNVKIVNGHHSRSKLIVVEDDD